MRTWEGTEQVDRTRQPGTRLLCGWSFQEEAAGSTGACGVGTPGRGGPMPLSDPETRREGVRTQDVGLGPQGLPP